MGRLRAGVVSVQQDKLGPLFRVVVEAQDSQAVHLLFVGLKGEDGGCASLKLLYLSLRHNHSLGVLATEVETLAEVLVGLRLAEVNLTEFGVGAVVEYHISAPPFL